MLTKKIYINAEHADGVIMEKVKFFKCFTSKKDLVYSFESISMPVSIWQQQKLSNRK